MTQSRTVRRIGPDIEAMVRAKFHEEGVHAIGAHVTGEAGELSDRIEVGARMPRVP